MNFIFNEDSDRISKDSVLLFTSFFFFYLGFVYKQGTIWCGIFRKIETKRYYYATILDLTVMLQHTSVSNCLNYVITIVC